MVRPLRTKKRFGTNDRNVPFGALAGKAATHQAAVGTRHVTRVPRARLRVCASGAQAGTPTMHVLRDILQFATSLESAISGVWLTARLPAPLEHHE